MDARFSDRLVHRTNAVVDALTTVFIIVFGLLLVWSGWLIGLAVKLR